MSTGQAVGVVIGGVLLLGAFGGCSLSGNGNGPDLGNESSSDNVAAHWNEITYGMTKGDVEAILGNPDDSQHMESNGYASDCIYYGSLMSSSYQFCFENDRLDSKNQY